MRRGRRRSWRRAVWPPTATLDHTEAHGCLAEAEPDNVSAARHRPRRDQCGTLGSGNHFLEVQVVDAIFDEQAARGDGAGEGHGLRDDPLGLARPGLSGLRRRPAAAARRAGEVRHRTCPTASWLVRRSTAPKGSDYLGAMCAAANFAWCNRQLLMQQAREVFEAVFGRSLGGAADEPGLRRGAQHRQVRGAHGRRRRRNASGCIAKEPRGRFRRITRKCPRRTARSASR